MGKQMPPPWIFNHWLVEEFCFSQDLDNWIYIGDYQRLPKNYYCRYCSPNSPSHIQFFGITHDQQDPHAVGACEQCNTVYWMELKIEAFQKGSKT